MSTPSGDFRFSLGRLRRSGGNPPLKERALPNDEASTPSVFELLRSVLTLGASSVLSIMIAIVLAKTWSTLLGPGKYGLAALMQSMLSLGGTVAGVGAGQALARESARAIGLNDQRRANALRVAALRLVVASSGLCAVLLILFRSPIARLVLGSSSHSDAVLLLAPALVALTATGVLSSVLVAHRRVAAIAKFNVASTGIYAIVGIPLVAVWRGSGIAPSLLIAAVLSCLLVLIVVRRQAGQVTRRVPLHEILQEIGCLLRFGMGYTFAACVGSGVLMVMPVLVLHLLNPASVGFYDAAVAISVNYVSLSTAALGQEYFPRLAAMRDHGARVVRAINDQIRLMRLVATPLLFLALALAPLGVPLLYSGAFQPAVTVLTWMIVADALRVPSWTMAWAVLAVRGSRLYMLLETFGGLSLLGAVVLGIRVFGLSGVGIGFLIGYGLYYAAVWLICRKALSLRLSRTNSVWTSLTIAGALAIQVISLRAPHCRTLIAVPVALIAVGLSVHVFWTEHRQVTEGSSD